MISKIIELNLFFILFYTINCNLINNRIQCDTRERDVESMLLNCTLIMPLTSNNDIDLLSDTNNFNNNDNNLMLNSNGDLRIGIDVAWKTPWESIKLNYAIFKSLVWRASRLGELGEYAFKNLQYLTQLDLSFNRLIFISERAFEQFEDDLLELDLSHNLFTQVPPLLNLIKFRHLQVFKFNSNKIQRISASRFMNLAQLRVLELSNCGIDYIDPLAFTHLRNLEILSLSGNYLRNIDSNTFNGLSALRFVYLHDNLFTCDCNLRWLLGYLRAFDQSITDQTQIQSLNALKCDQPNSLKSLRNLNFIDLNPDSFMCDVHIAKVHAPVANYELGEDAIFTCEVYGDPEPIIYWSFGDKFIDKSLTDDDKYYIYETRINRSHNTNKTSELRIKSLSQTDVGVYKCIGEISGSTNRKEVQFLIKSINFGTSGAYVFNFRSISNWTLLLLIAIAISICLFALLLITFVCIKCKKLKDRSSKSELVKSHDENDSSDEHESLNTHKQQQQQQQHHHELNNLKNIKEMDEDELDFIKQKAECLLYGTLGNNRKPSSQTNNAIYSQPSTCYYYDDLKQNAYNNDESSQLGLLHSSQHSQQLYASLRAAKSSNVTHTTPSIFAHYSVVQQKQHQHDNLINQYQPPLPPPLPPVPPPRFDYTQILPPQKPKRTFEHLIVNALNGEGSTTSLDEDLDLNDLKDFEDVTFDNLQKPCNALYSNKSSKKPSPASNGLIATVNQVQASNSLKSDSTISVTDSSSKSLLNNMQLHTSCALNDTQKIYEETEI